MSADNPGRGEPALDAKALAEAVSQLKAALATVGIDAPAERICEAIARRCIRAYIKAKPVVAAKGRYNKHTLEIAKLEIGQSYAMPSPVVHAALAQRFMTARKIMGNPGARWQVESDPDTNAQKVIRLNDWASPQIKVGESNPRAVFIAGIPLYGEAYLPEWWKPQPSTGRKQVSINVKIMARRILGKGYADWQQQTTNKGTKVKRIK